MHYCFAKRQNSFADFQSLGRCGDAGICFLLCLSDLGFRAKTIRRNLLRDRFEIGSSNRTAEGRHNLKSVDPGFEPASSPQKWLFQIIKPVSNSSGMFAELDS